MKTINWKKVGVAVIMTGLMASIAFIAFRFGQADSDERWGNTMRHFHDVFKHPNTG